MAVILTHLVSWGWINTLNLYLHELHVDDLTTFLLCKINRNCPMSKRRHTQRLSSFINLALILCTVAIFMPTPSAFSIQSKPASPLSNFGFTERQFEKRANEFLGIPYRKGGTSRKGLDCSGFTRMLYDRLFGIDLPRNSSEMYQFAKLQKTSDSGMQPGDLVFFFNKKKKRINHVGVYLSDGRFIHASTSQGIMVSRLDDVYWKQRFAGSKRHKDLNSGTKANKFHWESSLEIPIDRNGTITAHAIHEFSAFSPAFLQNNFDTFKDSLYDIPEYDKRYLNLYQIGFDHSVSNGLNVNLQAFSERFDETTAWTGLDSFSRSERYKQDDPVSDFGTRKGLKLASDIHPSNWLLITPFITYFNYSAETEDDWDVPRRTLGLNSLVAPEHGRWALSMQVKYSDQQDLVNTTMFDNTLNSLDMAVKLGINLTESLQFSIMGKHDIRTTAYENANDSSIMQQSASDIFLFFDFNY